MEGVALIAGAGLTITVTEVVDDVHVPVVAVIVKVVVC